MEKKHKAEEKRKRRLDRKNGIGIEPAPLTGELEAPEDND